MKSFDELEIQLGYRFKDQRLLNQALTHSSHAHEQNTGDDNEQLEFLGDAILGFVVSDLLYRAHPTLTEGQLSKLTGFFVSASNLVKYAEQLDLGQYLHLGRGEEKTGGRTKQALLVDSLEAIIGALYLDGGLPEPQRLIGGLFESQIAESGDVVSQLADFKTALQEILQARSIGTARYILAGESGPAHQKLFTVEIEVESKAVARGMGLTRKAAEQAAARQALQKLGRQEQDYPAHDRRHIPEIDSTRVL